jgi:hypothetical protein
MRAAGGCVGSSDGPDRPRVLTAINAQRLAGFAIVIPIVTVVTTPLEDLCAPFLVSWFFSLEA